MIFGSHKTDKIVLTTTSENRYDKTPPPLSAELGAEAYAYPPFLNRILLQPSSTPRRKQRTASTDHNKNIHDQPTLLKVRAVANKKAIICKEQYLKNSIAKGQELILKRRQLAVEKAAAAAAKLKAYSLASAKEKVLVDATIASLRMSVGSIANFNTTPDPLTASSLTKAMDKLVTDQYVYINGMCCRRFDLPTSSLPSSSSSSSSSSKLDMKVNMNSSSMHENTNMLWKAHVQGSRKLPPCSPRLGMLKPLSQQDLTSLTATSLSPWENDDDSVDGRPVRHLLLPSLS